MLAAAFARPGLVLVFALASAGLGAYAYSTLARDVFPDLSAPVFNVIVQNSAMAPEELEVGVSLPIETAMSGLPGVQRVRSRIEPGVVQVTIRFAPDWDFYRARQLVGERVAAIGAELPPGSTAPVLSSFTARINEVMELVLAADPAKLDLMGLRDLAELEVKNRLLGIPGVSAVERMGGHLRQFQVQVDPARLVARGVRFGEVLAAAREASKNAAGGFVVRGDAEWTLRAVGRTMDTHALGRIVVSPREGTPVLLSDVARIVQAGGVRRGLAVDPRGEVVSLRIIKQFGADTVALAAAVRAAVEDLRGALPDGASLEIAYDQGAVVERTLASVGRAVLAGAGLVLIILIALLGSWRGATLAALVLPLAVALAGLTLSGFGVGLNMMTLGGIAIAVGLVADATIIMVENITHHVGQPGAPPDAGLIAANEVARPIFFAVGIIIAVFLPVFLLDGLEGKLYRPLALAVIGSMLAALVLTLTVVPPLAVRVLQGRPDREVWIVRLIKRGYAPLLRAAMGRGTLTRLIALAVTAPVLFLATQLPSAFVPDMDEGAVLITTQVPPEASLAHVDRVNRRIESLVRGTPGVAKVLRRTGRPEDTAEPMPHTESDILLVLEADAEAPPVVAELRRRLRDVVGVNLLYTTPLRMRIDEGMGGTPAEIVVRVYGADVPTLHALAERAERIARSTPGMADVRREPTGGAPQLQVRIDRVRAARAQVTPGAIAEVLRGAMAGEHVGEVWDGPRRHDLVVRLGEGARAGLERGPAALRALLVDGPSGPLPLGEVARIEEASGLSSLRRERLSRRVAIEAMTTGDLGGTAKALDARLKSELRLPPGYFYELGGKVTAKAAADRALSLAVGIALALVVLLLYVAVGKLYEVLIILLTLPTAFVGGILALWFAGESWNVSSLVGLIGLFGIAVQNGMVVVTQTHAFRALGRTFEDALHEACVRRVRPNLMTTGTAILGLLPILLFPGGGTEVEKPLALVMIGGLVTSSLFTLLALPSFYELAHKLALRFGRDRDAKARPPATDVVDARPDGA